MGKAKISKILIVGICLTLLLTAALIANGDDIISEDNNSLVYKNAKYGFDFLLPESWKGFTIIDDEQWEGTIVVNDQGERGNESGPLIYIRHPLWTTENQRQDIPILVFTTTQWDSIQKGEFNVGAAPILPKELDHNDKYVFALPARYNYAFPTGYEEVEAILEGGPLQVNKITVNTADDRN